MRIFDERKGVIPMIKTPFTNLKFFDMSKSIKINPILPRSGEKNRYVIHY